MCSLLQAKLDPNDAYSNHMKTATVKRIRLSQSAVRNVVYCGNDDLIVTISDDEKSVHIWDVWNRQIKREIKNHTRLPLSQIKVTSKTNRLLGAGFDSFLYLWDLETGTKVWERETEYGLLCCDLSADDRTVATGSDVDGSLRFWDLRNGQVVHETTNCLSGSLTSLSYSPIADKIAVTSLSGPTRIYDLRAQSTLLTFKEPGAFVTDLSYSKNGRKLLVPCISTDLFLFDLATGSYRCNPRDALLDTARPAAFTCCVFSPGDSGYFACGSSDGRILIWELENTSQVLFDRPSHQDAITDCAFSPSGNYLMTVCSDGTGRVWDVVDMKMRIRKTQDLAESV